MFTVLFYGCREMSAATVKNKTWNKTRVQGLLRHRGGAYYARLYVAGKEKWLSLVTSLLEVAKAKLEEEKKALAEAKKTGWEEEVKVGRFKTSKEAQKQRDALYEAKQADTKKPR